MSDIFGKPMYPSLAEWTGIIEDRLDNPGDEPIWNVAPPEVDDRPFDAIFLGGGGAGRFGASFMRARGGRPLLIEKWPFLGGSCPHEACVPHHILSECAKELDRAKWFSGQLWFPEFDPKKVSILDCIELVKEGRAGAHALMNVQTKEQLDVEYVLNAWGNVIDKNTVEVAGRTFTGKNLVLGTGVRTQYPEIPGVGLKGVYDFATLLSDLDYEPSRCVIIGGSKVAMEYGSFFQAAGVQTTILTRSPLMRTASLHHIDEDLRRYVIEMMELRGIDIVEGAEPAEILGNGRVTGVVYRNADGNDVTIETDFVFIATGERPTQASQAFIDLLGLETDDRGFVVVNKRMETSVPGIYAVGDLIGPPMEQFKARHSGCCAARNIMGEDYEWDCERIPRLSPHDLRGRVVRPHRGRGPGEVRQRHQDPAPAGRAAPRALRLPGRRGHDDVRLPVPGADRLRQARDRRRQPQDRRGPLLRVGREERLPVPRPPHPPARGDHHR